MKKLVLFVVVCISMFMTVKTQAQSLPIYQEVNGFFYSGFIATSIDPNKTYTRMSDTGYGVPYSQEFSSFGIGYNMGYGGYNEYDFSSYRRKILSKSMACPDSVSYVGCITYMGQKIDYLTVIFFDNDSSNFFTYFGIPSWKLVIGQWQHITTNTLNSGLKNVVAIGLQMYCSTGTDSVYSGITVLLDSLKFHYTNQFGGDSVVLVESFGNDISGVAPHHIVPKDFGLYQNYPNPFNPSTRIEYDIATSGDVKLSVYNLLGQEVSTLADGYQSAGRHTAIFDASHMASGTYFYILTSGSQRIVKKMVLLK